MTKLTDGKRTVGITLMQYDGLNWSPDWSNDFFAVGGLEKAPGTDDTYLVEDVDYCIDYAKDWRLGRGDFHDDQFDVPDFDPDDRLVNVEDL